jgi:phenylacetate-CoA ligase
LTGAGLNLVVGWRFALLAQRFQNLISQTVGYGLMHRRVATNRRISRLYRSLVENEFRDAEYYRAAQLDRLRALLVHAGARVPYYRELFRELDFDPNAIRDVSELGRLPRLTKDIIRKRAGDLIADNVQKGDLLENFTGGSTGQAMAFYQDDNYLAEGGAASAFSNHLAGWRPGLPHARLWGAPRDLAEYTSFRAKVRCYFYNSHQFNAFELSDDRLSRYDRSLASIQPCILVCYASAAYRLADFLRREGRRAAYPTRGIVTSAEMLYPKMREAIEEVFPVRVFDRYACREVGAISSECDAHAGYHEHMLVNVVEVDSSAEKGEACADEGDLIVTNLSNYAMPFIRYEIGDRATRLHGACPCGRGTRRLGVVTGRTTDFFRGRDGNYIAGPSLTLLFYGVQSIERYQLIQHDYDRYELKIVPTQQYDDGEIDRLLKRIRTYLGEQADFDVRRVEEIPPTEQGKYRFIVCNMKGDASVTAPQRDKVAKLS